MNLPASPTSAFASDNAAGAHPAVLDAIDAQGIADNTIVIFTSDNGAKCGSNYPLTGRKWDVLEGGIREDDSRGRHTTSGRSMHRLAGGGR